MAGSVELELDDYLECGRLEHGFLRGRCDSCHAEHLAAFRAANAWLLPELRCAAHGRERRAALLMDEVFPERPVRPWGKAQPLVRC